MELLDLVDLALRRGCGHTLREAEATQRFQWLRSQLHGTDYPAQRAAVEYLGGALIEAATDCLPNSVAETARQWRALDAAGQTAVLREVFQALQYDFRSGAYPNDRYRGLRGAQRPAAVLPREHGRWLEGPFRPSCVGMGTLLMAFARLTGARHGYVQVLRTSQLAALQVKLRVYAWALEGLGSTLPLAAQDGLEATIIERCKTVIKDLERVGRYDFHPALIIQTDDGCWHLCDPYMKLLCEVPADINKAIARAVTTLEELEHGRVVLIGCSGTFDRARQEAKRGLDEIFGVAKTILDMPGYSGLPPLERIGAIASHIEGSSRKPHFNYLGPLLTESGCDAQRLATFGMFGDRFRAVTDRHVDVAGRIFEKYPGEAELAVQRLLSYPSRMWLNQVIPAVTSLMGQTIHPAVELSLPPNGVAVNVLNNLLCWLEPEPGPPELGGQLVRYSASQTMWHDATLRPHESFGPDIANGLESQRAYLSTLPTGLLHPRVARLLGRAGERTSL